MNVEEDRIQFLLVEDNDHDIAAIKRAWKKSGVSHPLQVVPGGKSCLRFLADRIGPGEAGLPSSPVVVLLNDKMATMGGVETLAKIRETDDMRHVPVIMLMASDETYRELKTYRMGANAYIVKPMRFETLVEAIGTIVEFWELAELPKNGQQEMDR